jgi:diguanylate cyclase (GGDEF)-like protein/PAS domain S-box-containing protein
LPLFRNEDRVHSLSEESIAAGVSPIQLDPDFTGVLEAVPDAMVGVDRAGVIRFVNRQTEAMFGYDRDFLVGRLIETLVPESFRTVHQGQREGFLADPKVRQLATGPELTGRRRDGTEFPVDIGLAHIGTGDDVLVVAAVRDMTARHESEESRRQADRLAAVVEFSADAILSGTPEGVISSWNPAAERLFGYPGEEVIGKSGILLCPSGQSDDAGSFLSMLSGGRSLEDCEAFLVRKDGSLFPASLTVSPIFDEDGAVVAASAIVHDISERRRAFEATQRMAAIVESSDDAIVGKTLEGIVTSWNPAARRMYGYASEEIVGRSIELLSPTDRTGEIVAMLAEIKAGEHIDHFETVRVRKDGTEFPVSLSISPICDSDGKVVGVSTNTRDVTEQKEAALNAQRLTVAEDLIKTVMTSAHIGIALADAEGLFKIVNQALCDFLGYDEGWFLAHRLDDLVHPDDVEKALQDLTRRLTSGDKSFAPVRLVRAGGSTVWVRLVVVEVPGADDQPNLVMFQMEDITDEHEAHEALAYQAFHDPLTGLHNRAWILDALDSDLRAARRLGASVGTLLLDLDHLKVVNDSLGHGAGDEVLAAVAGRIAAALRPGDRVGRFGGDEFVIVVQNVCGVEELEHCAERISASIGADLDVHGHRIAPTASIGIAISTPTSTPEALLRDTDSALFRAKATGRGHWQLFDKGMHAQAMARLTVEDELRDAINRKEFRVHYQPIVALADARVVGHEALVRWMHPVLSLLTPEAFLDVAEDTGLITTIGAQVLDQTCAMIAGRPDLPGPISVNVSAVQLADPGWLSGFKDTLVRRGVEPQSLVIEVTETAVLNLPDYARQALASLRGLGIGIHVDDFGTGYSSISLLRDLPVTGVKLDLRFVHELTTGDSLANALAQGLSGLVNGLHLTGIAEGIETQMQAAILREQGWQCGQGYYFGRPAPSPFTGPDGGGKSKDDRKHPVDRRTRHPRIGRT